MRSLAGIATEQKEVAYLTISTRTSFVSGRSVHFGTKKATPLGLPACKWNPVGRVDKVYLQQIRLQLIAELEDVVRLLEA